jgi:tRNA pseudouridine32 synthase/23S rRNA pseudouridine746 synthase
MQKLSLTKTVGPNDPTAACKFLAEFTALSKSRIKDAMAKGAVWLKKQKNKQHRCRRATAGLKPGDILSIYYDKALLLKTPPPPELISDQGRYSIWLKPAGLMSQGTKYGDHCSLLRQAALHFKSKRKVYLIHRLDREAAGLVLLAHDKTAAGRLSHLFQKQQVIKRYTAKVVGNLAAPLPGDKIDLKLDGKSALTEVAVDHYDRETDTSKVYIVIRTGRKHQIRRHFEMIGHPVMGDPRYGKGNKNKEGMQLAATGLEFQCPFKKKKLVFEYTSGL